MIMICLVFDNVDLIFKVNGWIFFRLAWIYHCDMIMICLVFDNVDFIFKVKVLLVGYLLNQRMDFLQTCTYILLRQAEELIIFW